MNPIELFATFNGHDIRWNNDPSNPYWIAQDVCSVLGLGNPHMTCRSFPKSDLIAIPLLSGGQKREFLAVNEAGLYRLIFKSRKPEAQKFQDWVFREVLVSIRQNGFYLGKPMSMLALKLQAKEKQFDYQVAKLMVIRREISDMRDALRFEQLELPMLPTIDVKHHKRRNPNYSDRSPIVDPVDEPEEEANG